MSTAYKDNKVSFIKNEKYKTERKEKIEEIISIPHQPLKNEPSQNKKSFFERTIRRRNIWVCQAGY